LYLIRCHWKSHWLFNFFQLANQAPYFRSLRDFRNQVKTKETVPTPHIKEASLKKTSSFLYLLMSA